MKIRSRIFLTFFAVFGFTLFAGCGAGNSNDYKISISMEQLDQEVQRTKTDLEGRGYFVPDVEAFKPEVLKQMIETEILMRIIKAEKIKLEKGFLDSEIESIIAQYFESEEDFYSYIAGQGFTKESFREDYEKSLIQKRYYDEIISVKVEVTDNEIQTFYDEHPEYFQKEESVVASHILVEVGADFTEAQKRDAMSRIKDILAKARRGEDFAGLAREYSEGPSSVDGGDLGEFTRGQMVPEFEEAAFALDPGEISDVVETQYGYHIIKLFEKNPASVMPLDDEIFSQIQAYLVDNKAQIEMDTLIDNERPKYKLDIPIEVTWE